jgi:uncharacterized repeat protein (TIGR01451 family)
MARYVFIAAAALFAGLLFVLALSLAQRDARIGHSLSADAPPPYAAQPVAPISVHKAALEEDASTVVTASHAVPISYDDPPRSRPTNGLTEPRRFDASRILSKRPASSLPVAPLLNPLEPPRGKEMPVEEDWVPPVMAPSLPEPTSMLSPPATATLGPPRAELPTTTESLPELPIAAPGLNSLPGILDVPNSLPAIAPPPMPSPSPSPSVSGSIPKSSSVSDQPSTSAPRRLEERSSVSSSAPVMGDSRTPSGRGAWSMSSGAPGSRQFDGSQNPSLEIVKRAPAEVQVGIPATFTAIVRNVGNATAFDVEVCDTVPQGAKLVRTLPQAELASGGGLVWKLRELAAGQESTIHMELVPESEGEIGSVASVKFAAQASVRTMSTLPKLSIKQWAPSEILGGDSVTIWIEITNVGTGTAKGVELEESVPAAFRHTSGARSLGLEVGDLAPGESQRYEIELTAIEAAKVSNVVRATSRNAATSESSQPMEVRAPKLQLQLNGPRIRYLERPAPFEAVIENVGTAVARDLYIVAYLPRGLHFSSANNEGTYLPDQHAIAWNLAELAAGTRAKTEFMALPVEEGKSLVRMTSDAEGLGVENIEREVQVEGQSELIFDIDDDHDPIETNGVTTYTVNLTNIGTRPDQNVVLSLEIPDGSAVEQVESTVKYRVQGRTVLFDPYPVLPPKDRTVVKIRVRHGREGTHVFRASLQSDLRPVPVLKEESTKVYVDR